MAFEIRNSTDGKQGTKESFALQVGEQPNGLPFLLPVMTVNGVKDGPTLFVNAAMHGDETLGTEAVRQAWRLLDPKSISGRLVMIPMANLAAVANRTRRNMIEMYPGPHDMNRVFPGNTHGVLTERIANRIMTDFVRKSDYAFDIHCASVGGEWLPYTAIPAVGTTKFKDGVVEGSRKLGEAFGTPLILEDFDYPGSLVQSAQNEGIPACMVEFGVATQSTKEERIWGRSGVIRLAKAVGNYDGPILMFDDTEPPEAPSPIVVREMTRIYSDHGGFLHRRKFVGDRVVEGDNLAVLMSLDGEEVANFNAPHDGVVVRSNTMGVIGTGDIVSFVGRIASEGKGK